MDYENPLLGAVLIVVAMGFAIYGFVLLYRWKKYFRR